MNSIPIIPINDNSNYSKGKKKLPPAPTKLTALPNPDKLDHESYEDYSPNENLARFPHPFRCVILGKVNSGKSLLCKHILLSHQAHNPKFKEVYVVHGCESSEEYDDIQATEIMAEIPSYNEFDREIKKLIIVDDYDFSAMKADTLKKISELWRFGSTHCSTSLILLHQSFFNTPKIVKNCTNVFIIFRPNCLDELKTIGRRIGLNKKQILYIFDTYLPHYRDSLCVNLIPGAPHRYLRNLYEPLDIKFPDSF